MDCDAFRTKVHRRMKKDEMATIEKSLESCRIPNPKIGQFGDR